MSSLIDIAETAHGGLERGACLFCGKSPADPTEEDVFPEWLQKTEKLNDGKHGKLTSLNGDKINYSRLKVPACRVCNGVFASSLENRIRNHKASELDYFIWAEKIFIGVCYFETGRVINPDPGSGLHRTPILDDVLPSLFHVLFHSLRVPVEIIPNPPGSVLRFTIPEQHPFIFGDVIEPASFYMIFDKTLLIVFFDDATLTSQRVDSNRVQKDLNDGIEPIEVISRLLYRRLRIHNRSKYLLSDEMIMVIPPFTIVDEPFDKEKMQKLYNRFIGRLGVTEKLE